MASVMSDAQDVRKPVSESGALRRQPVNRFEFARLAISNRRLVRANVPEEGLCGLLDEESRTWYVIPEQELEL